MAGGHGLAVDAQQSRHVHESHRRETDGHAVRQRSPRGERQILIVGCQARGGHSGPSNDGRRSISRDVPGELYGCGILVSHRRKPRTHADMARDEECSKERSLGQGVCRRECQPRRGRRPRGSESEGHAESHQSGRVRSQPDGGEILWFGGRTVPGSIQTGTQHLLQGVSHVRWGETARGPRVTPRVRHAHESNVHRRESASRYGRKIGLFFPLRGLVVFRSESTRRHAASGHHRRQDAGEDALGHGVLRRGGIHPGGESETRPVARIDPARFGGEPSIRGTHSLPVAAGEKQHRGGGARPIGGRGRKLPDAANGKTMVTVLLRRA